MPDHCRNCLMPDGGFAVQVAGDGVCNYCRHWETNRDRYRIDASSRERLKKRFAAMKGRYKYDALVGLSGGKDSTYVLYKLVREYGLKCWAVTYDNGFLTDYARENVKRIVADLGVDHFFHLPRWANHKLFYRAALKRIGDPCVPCAIGGYFFAMKFCYEHQIPFFVHGRSPYQMFRNYYPGSPDIFLPMIDGNLGEYSPDGLRRLYGLLDQRIKAWLNAFFDTDEERTRIHREFFPEAEKMTGDLAPEFLGLFLFEPYDEEKIKQELETNTGYRRPVGDAALFHGDCSIHDAGADLWQKVHGINLLAPEVAAMLRQGAIDLPAARELLGRRVVDPREVNAAMDRMCARLDFGRQELDGLLDELRKRKTGKFDSH